jgi:hypothetical protein
MKKTLHYFFSMAFLQSVCMWTLILFIVFPINNVAAGQPDHSKINKIHAIGNTLDSVERRLDKLLMSYDGETTVPKGMEGKLMAMERELVVKEKQLTKIVDAIPERRMNDTSVLEEALEDVGQYAIRIAGLAQVGSQMPLNLGILDAFVKLKGVSENLAQIVQVYFEFVWDKVIPIRFVQVLKCYPFIQSCQSHLDWDSIDASVDSFNAAVFGIGVRLWIKSVESYYIPWFSDEELAIGEKFFWGDAKYEIEQVFPIPSPPSNLLPYDRRANEWIAYMSTIFSDPTEILVWVFGRDSLVSREIDRHSISSFPDGGRFVIISAQNIYSPNRDPKLSPYHLTHELGHFFGLPHTWDIGGPHPTENRQVSRADLWDLSYCDGMVAPVFFNSKQEALEATYCVPDGTGSKPELKPIEYHPCPCGEYNSTDQCLCLVQPNCKVNNRDGTGNSGMVCELNNFYSYFSGDNALKGLSFDLGTVENFPDSFAYGLNVMGYYSRYNAHLWTPGRFSASQLELIKGHTQNEVPINNTGFYWPYTDLWSQRSVLGN